MCSVEKRVRLKKSNAYLVVIKEIRKSVFFIQVFHVVRRVSHAQLESPFGHWILFVVLDVNLKTRIKIV